MADKRTEEKNCEVKRFPTCEMRPPHSFREKRTSPQPAKSFQTPVLEPQLLSLQKAMLGMTVLSQRPVADILVSKVLQGQEERLAEGTGTGKQDSRYSGL